MEKVQKITIHIPQKLLKRALKSSGQGITSTVKQGLELVAAAQAYDELRRLKGKVTFSLDLAALRED